MSDVRNLPPSSALDAKSVVLEHLADIVTLCNRMLRRPSDAEDATHEAVLAILRKLPTYRGDGSLRHWVLKVALNAARQHRRSLARMQGRRGELPAEEVASAVEPNPVDARDQSEALRAAMAELPDDLREAMVLHYHHGLTQSEVAACLGCSQKTVSVRLARGRERLQRVLAGSGALAALLAAGAAGQCTLDAVPVALATSVQHTMAGYVAAATPTVASAATASLTTAGVVMNAKLIAGAATLTVAGLIGGVLLSDTLRGADRDEAHVAEVADLETRIADERRVAEQLDQELTLSRRRHTTQLQTLTDEARTLRETLAARDQELAALPASDAPTSADDAAAANAGDAGATRQARWKELRKTMAPVLAILDQMEEEGANQFALGPRMVAELGKLGDDEFDAIVAFDAEESDPTIIGDIRSVMLQALIFMPSVDEHRDDFMGRYLDRVENGGYGESFTHGALRRISFEMPPFVDAYKKIVEPLDEPLRERFVDMAVERATRGDTGSHRLDGLEFLRRTPGARATTALIEVARQSSTDARLRIAAVKGLAGRTDADAIQALSDLAESDQNEAVRAAAAAVVK